VRSAEEVLARLESLADPGAAAGMARFGITGEKIYGVKIPVLRSLAKELGRDHRLAEELWALGARETRILAAMIADHRLLTPARAEAWLEEVDSWEVCDQLCQNLLQNAAWAQERALKWAGRPEEFVKRAGFVVLARLAVTGKAEPEDIRARYLPALERGAADGRNYVKKAVSWGLREIGKRYPELHQEALALAAELKKAGGSAAWVGSDVWRELDSDKVKTRIAARKIKDAGEEG